MLVCAIKENPDSNIYIKVHPDMLQNPNRGGVTNQKYGHFTDIDLSGYKNVFLLSEYCNPIGLLKSVDKVYVCTSQMGFESLLCGKETHIFGSPFYAGYGVGIQRSTSKAILRRTTKRSIEEIFYISYIKYSKYYHPLKRQECEIEDIIDFLMYAKKLYEMEFNHDKNISTNNLINIAFSFDKKYIVPLMVSILSLLTAKDDQCTYNIHILHSNEENSDLLKIERYVKKFNNLNSIRFYNIGNYFNNGYEVRGISRATYYRLLLPSIIDQKIDTIIYSDSDYLYFRGLNFISQINIGNYYLAACPDIGLNSST